MKAWLLLLGGMLIWLTHFSALYAISSIAVVADAPAFSERGAVAAATLLAGAGDIGVLALALARSQAEAATPTPERFVTRVAALGAFISLLAVLWQGLPAMVFA